MTYWTQFSKEEIDDMQGVEDCIIEDLDTEMCQDEDDTNSCHDECPKCSGRGCNYCLMCDY